MSSVIASKLIKHNTECANWNEIKLDLSSEKKSIEECEQHCMRMGCVQFGYAKAGLIQNHQCHLYSGECTYNKWSLRNGNWDIYEPLSFSEKSIQDNQRIASLKQELLIKNLEEQLARKNAEATTIILI